MSDIQAEFSLLKQTTDPAVADAILRLIESGEDHELNRINPLDFSKRTGLDEERVISGCSNFPGMCCVPVAVACSAPTQR
jgi:hypothetical protein